MMSNLLALAGGTLLVILAGIGTLALLVWSC